MRGVQARRDRSWPVRAQPSPTALHPTSPQPPHPTVPLRRFGKQDTLGPFRDDDEYADEPWQPFSQDEYAGGLRELCDWATGTGATVLLALPIPFPFGSAAHSCASVILPATQAVAQELSLATIDLYSSFRDQVDKFTDADHLTDDAIDLLASSVAAAVSAARPKL